jgi:hypothetical protein
LGLKGATVKINRKFIGIAQVPDKLIDFTGSRWKIGEDGVKRK